MISDFLDQYGYQDELDRRYAMPHDNERDNELVPMETISAE